MSNASGPAAGDTAAAVTLHRDAGRVHRSEPHYSTTRPRPSRAGALCSVLLLFAAACGGPQGSGQAATGADGTPGSASAAATLLRAEAQERLARGDAAGARALLERAVAAARDDADAWNALGLAQQAGGDLPAAQGSFERAIQLAPRRYEAHLNLAVLLMKRGVTGRARTEFEQAVEAHPGDPLPYWNFATALADVGQLEPARQLLETALGLDPRNGPAHAEMARVESRSGRAAAALHHFAVAETLGVNSPVFWANHGLELLNAGEYAAAESHLQRAASVDSTRATTWNHLGVARLRLARTADAIAAFRRARTLAPADEDIRFNLGNALVRSNQFPAAVSLLAGPKPARADLLALSGMALRGAGRTPEAVPLLAEAAAKAPRDVNVLNNYGVVLAETGDLPRALETWRRVLEIEPGNRVARDNLAARGGP